MDAVSDPYEDAIAALLRCSERFHEQAQSVGVKSPEAAEERPATKRHPEFFPRLIDIGAGVDDEERGVEDA